MKLNHNLLLIAFMPCLITSCKLHTRKHIGPHTDIYVAGSLYTAYNKSTHSGGITNAVYWKNGLPVLLTDTLKDSMVNAIAVKNGDVYVAGRINDTAVYWKNGIPTKLGPGMLYSIAIRGKDVYVAGVAFTNGPEIAAYWKNGMLDTLGVGRIVSITIDGDDIYMVGYKNKFAVYNDGVTREYKASVCWKNGKEAFEYIVDGSTANVEGICVRDGDVYVAGSIDYLAGSTLRKPAPCYWKNYKRHNLGTKLYPSGTCNSIYVDNNGKYVACGTLSLGYQNLRPVSIAVYCKNDTLMSLKHVSKFSSAAVVATLGNDVYIAGQDGYPVYWKNGSRIQLGDRSGTAAALVLVNY